MACRNESLRYSQSALQHLWLATAGHVGNQRHNFPWPTFGSRCSRSALLAYQRLCQGCAFGLQPIHGLAVDRQHNPSPLYYQPVCPAVQGMGLPIISRPNLGRASHIDPRSIPMPSECKPWRGIMGRPLHSLFNRMHSVPSLQIMTTT
jgi:hypothetical protein